MMKKNEVKIAPRVNIIEECRREIYILVPNNIYIFLSIHIYEIRHLYVQLRADLYQLENLLGCTELPQVRWPFA